MLGDDTEQIVQDETGKSKVYKGEEALRMAYDELGQFRGNLTEALNVLYIQKSKQSWTEIWEELREAFRDPTNEAAAAIGWGMS